MDNRFSPDWRSVEPSLERLIRELAGDEHLLVNAFQAVSDPALYSRSALEVKDHLRGIVISPGTPWVLFETISELLRSLPLPMRSAIVRLIDIGTGHSYERLNVTVDGRWQVSWQLTDGGEPEYQYIGLDWYLPQERDKAPVVPLPIIDYVAGSVSLLRGRLVLPAATLLLIALESVLWEDLEARGVVRSSERIVYTSVTWDFRIVGEKLVISICGADESLKDLRAKMSPVPEGRMLLKKLRHEGDQVILQIALASDFLAYFASEREESRESYSEKGLAEAIQRARAGDVIRILPVQLDETLYRLRNYLVHLPSGEELNPPVPVPSGQPVTSLLNLRQNPQFIKELIYIVVNLINNLYATRVEA